MISTRIALTSDDDWESIPEDLRRSFSAEERLAFTGGASYFKLRSRECDETLLVDYFNQLRDGHLLHVTCEKNASNWEKIFSFTCGRVLACPIMQVRSSRLYAPELPPRVNRLYDSFGALLDERANAGFMPESQIQRLVRVVPNSQQDGLLFLSLGNGDLVGVDSEGAGVFYDHERQTLQSVDCDSMIDEFFVDFSKGPFEELI